MYKKLKEVFENITKNPKLNHVIVASNCVGKTTLAIELSKFYKGDGVVLTPFSMMAKDILELTKYKAFSDLDFINSIKDIKKDITIIIDEA